MTEKYTYRDTVKWIEGKKGVVKTDGKPDIVATPPPEFGGPRDTLSPEDLFVGNANICFMTTFTAIAEHSGLKFIDYQCKAEGVLEKSPEKGRGYFFSSITLYPEIVVSKDEDIDLAKLVLDKSIRACIVSNSIKPPTTLNPNIKVEKK